ncbi:MAG: hypothetical protein Q7R89_02255, partial [bacterium]|nr:hypothetical protein [bacterium]
LPSPFHSEEGLPIQDGIRRRYGVKAGFRPFSTNPYGYVSFGTKPDAWGESFQVNTRVYATDWQEGHLQLVGNYYFNSKSALVLACDARPWLSAEKKSEGNKSLALSAGFQTILPLGTFFVGVSGPSTIIKAAYSLDW